MMMEESVQHVVMTAIQEVKYQFILNGYINYIHIMTWSCNFNVFPQLMSKETPVTGGNDSYVDLDRQVWSFHLTTNHYIT